MKTLNFNVDILSTTFSEVKFELYSENVILIYSNSDLIGDLKASRKLRTDAENTANNRHVKRHSST